MPDLLDRRLIVVTGKGGVGKSLVAASLGLAAARSGRRTLVVEVAARDDVPRLLVAEGGAEREVAPNLHHHSIDPRRALTEYLHEQLPLGVMAGLLGRSEMFLLFAAAAPGVRELLTMGKVAELTRDRRDGGARRYDLVVLDAPSTANGLALLTAPRTFAASARVGPIARQGTEIDELVCDPDRTGVVLVATPEEMPVTEAIDLRGDVLRVLDRDVDHVIANAMLPARFGARDREALRGAPDDPAVRSAQWLQHRAGLQQAQRARLRRGCASVPGSTLPFLFVDEPGPADVERLAGILERAA